MKRSDLKKLVEALRAEGEKRNLVVLNERSTWIQFRIDGVPDGGTKTAHYEIRWSKMKGDKSGHDGKSLFVEIHAEQGGFAKKFKDAKNELGGLEFFEYGRKYSGFRLKDRVHDIEVALHDNNFPSQKFVEEIFDDFDLIQQKFEPLVRTIANTNVLPAKSLEEYYR